MSKRKKRTYSSTVRSAQAAETRARILSAAKSLFESQGFERVTIEKIAQVAAVSAPTVYALFQSKRGVLCALMDEAFPHEQFEALVGKSHEVGSPQERLFYCAKIARQLYDAERAQMELFRGATVLAPEFRELEEERERRRHSRQEATIKAIAEGGALVKDLSISQARDLLWALTGRDLYRMLVIEQGWKPEEYEKELARLLVRFLVQD